MKYLFANETIKMSLSYAYIYAYVRIQLPQLRKESRRQYVDKRHKEKLDDLRMDIEDDEYLFDTSE